MAFAQDLLRAREAAGLTQAAAASFLKEKGVKAARRTLAAWEGGENEPDPHKAEAVLQALWERAESAQEAETNANGRTLGQAKGALDMSRGIPYAQGSIDPHHRSQPSHDPDRKALEAKAHYLGRALLPAERPAVAHPEALEELVRHARATPFHTLFAVDDQGAYARVEGDLHILDLAGYTRGEMLGRPVRSVLRPHHSAVVAPLYEDALAGHPATVTLTYGTGESAVDFACVFLPALHGRRRYAVALASPLSGSFREGMKQRSETVMLRHRGAWNMEIALVMRSDDPLTVDVELPTANR